MMPALQNSTSIGRPLSCEASSLAWPGFATSSLQTRAPVCFSDASEPRTVPMTDQPSAWYWRASSRPRPRPAPVMRMVGKTPLGRDLGLAADDFGDRGADLGGARLALHVGRVRPLDDDALDGAHD